MELSAKSSISPASVPPTALPHVAWPHTLCDSGRFSPQRQSRLTRFTEPVQTLLPLLACHGATYNRRFRDKHQMRPVPLTPHASCTVCPAPVRGPPPLVLLLLDLITMTLLRLYPSFFRGWCTYRLPLSSLHELTPDVSAFRERTGYLRKWVASSVPDNIGKYMECIDHVTTHWGTNPPTSLVLHRTSYFWKLRLVFVYPSMCQLIVSYCLPRCLLCADLLGPYLEKRTRSAA